MEDHHHHGENGNMDVYNEEEAGVFVGYVTEKDKKNRNKIEDKRGEDEIGRSTRSCRCISTDWSGRQQRPWLSAFREASKRV